MVLQTIIACCIGSLVVLVSFMVIFFGQESLSVVQIISYGATLVQQNIINAARSVITFSYLAIVAEMVCIKYYTQFPNVDVFRCTYAVVCTIFVMTSVIQFLFLFKVSPMVTLVTYVVVAGVSLLTCMGTWILLSRFMYMCNMLIIQKKQIQDLHYVVNRTRSSLVDEDIKRETLSGLLDIFPSKSYKFSILSVDDDMPGSDSTSTVRCIPLKDGERLCLVEAKSAMSIPQLWLETLGQHVNLALDHSEVLSRALKLSHMKTEFLMMMSHEVRTPLTGVINMLDLLLTTHLDEEQFEYADTARISGKLLMLIINDILDFSKLGVHALKLELDVVDPIKFCKDLGMFALANSSLRSVELDLDLDQNESLKLFNVICDSARLQQVIMGIVNNAIKFTKRGTVRLKIRFTYPGEDQISMMAVEVEDDGPGIPDSIMKVLYQPFVKNSVQCNYTTTGTGLGLAIARRLIEIMKGTLDIRTECGKGTHVSIEIPLKTEKKAKIPTMVTPARLSADVKPPGQCKILLAEDNIINQKTLTRILLKLGYNDVTLVNDGEEALNALNNKDAHYNIVLLDNLMPKMNGDEVCRQMRKQGRDDVIICVSANVLANDYSYFLSVGMNDVISKPVDIKEMELKLAYWATWRC
jgi:signal transduction histidine kinase/methylmalonyl-CoA mutase cobalamin-binding subunit